MRLGSGIAPIRLMIDEGVNIGIGVDGSSSNDSAHMLNEVRQTMLLQRVKNGPETMTAREALRACYKGRCRSFKQNRYWTNFSRFCSRLCYF